MKAKIECTWKEDMSFESEVDGHKIVIDAAPEVGGKERGPRPKPLTLLSLAGCTGMDVISILNKMRVNVDYFNVVVEADLTEEHPKHYDKFHLVYEFKGKDLPMDKLEKAVKLSQDKYCGVTAMLSKGASFSHEIKII